MKKEYTKPVVMTVHIAGKSMLLAASNNVNEYKRGSDIYVGDDDDEPKAQNIWSK